MVQSRQVACKTARKAILSHLANQQVDVWVTNLIECRISGIDDFIKEVGVKGARRVVVCAQIVTELGLLREGRRVLQRPR